MTALALCCLLPLVDPLQHLGIVPPRKHSLLQSPSRSSSSFELRAAFDLARLYNSTSRPRDAHALLASALKGFSPTPEFPEIAEAKTLLASLA
jgi:hypothetical protein